MKPTNQENRAIKFEALNLLSGPLANDKGSGWSFKSLANDCLMLNWIWKFLLKRRST